MQLDEASLIITSNPENSATNGNFTDTQEAQTSLVIPDSRNTEDDDDDNDDVCNNDSSNVTNGKNNVIREKQSIAGSINSNGIPNSECKRLVNSFGLQYTNSFKVSSVVSLHRVFY